MDGFAVDGDASLSGRDSFVVIWRHIQVVYAEWHVPQIAEPIIITNMVDVVDDTYGPMTVAQYPSKPVHPVVLLAVLDL